MVNHVDIIFVTEDAKEDWWDKKDGKRTPHKELIREFCKETGGQYILMYQQKGFLEASKQNVKETTATEIEEVSKEDERISRERTEQILEGLRQSWASQIPVVPAYSTADLMKILNNPLPEILAEQRRKVESLRSPLETAIGGLAYPSVPTPVEAARAVIGAYSPTSILKQMTQEKK